MKDIQKEVPTVKEEEYIYPEEKIKK